MSTPRGLADYRRDNEIDALRSRVATLEYEVARLREQFNEHDHDDEPLILRDY